MSGKYYTILLGAGASKDAGVPTSKDLLDGFMETLTDEVARRLQKTLRENPTIANAEDLALILLEQMPIMYNKLRAFTVHQISNHGDVSYLKNLFSFDLDQMNGMVVGGKPFWKLVKPTDLYVLPKSSTRVFTLNYDTCVEDAMDDWTSNYAHLFRMDAVTREFSLLDDPQFDENEGWFVKKGEDLQFRQPKPCFFKLHGSVNWVWKIRSGHKKLLISNNPRDSKRELIFGEPQKARFTIPYCNLLPVFTQSIHHCSALIAIGYSWSDNHINNVIEQAVSFRNDLKVINVNLIDWRNRRPKVLLPQDLVTVDAKCRDALMGREVKFAVGDGKPQVMKNGLVGIVRNVLAKMLYR